MMTERRRTKKIKVTKKIDNFAKMSPFSMLDIDMKMQNIAAKAKEKKEMGRTDEIEVGW